MLDEWQNEQGIQGLDGWTFQVSKLMSFLPGFSMTLSFINLVLIRVRPVQPFRD